MTFLGAIGSIAASVQSQYQHAVMQSKKHCHDPQVGADTKAQTDVVSLSQSINGLASAGSAFGQILNSIGQAIQSGDLTGAQQAVDAIAKVGPCAVPKGSHVPPMVEKLTEGLSTLGEALGSGDQTAAQQAYTAVQQLWQQMSPNASAWRTLGNSSGVSVHS